MRILVSNDDGYQAPGIIALAEALSTVAEVTVVAPSRNRSATSNSITLDRGLVVHRAANGFYFVDDGTPADCVHLAVTGFLDFRPDLIVSGINDGSNLGDDTIYSGTVAAAMEGYLLGIPGLAVSLAARPVTHFATAAQVALDLVNRIQSTPPVAPWLLNVNVPDMPFEALRGVAVTRMGRRDYKDEIIRRTDPRGGVYYWIGGAEPSHVAAPGTDFEAILEGRVSITPLHRDVTNQGAIAALAEWDIAL